MSALDARHPLQRRYYRRMRNAMFAATALHVAAFVYAPPYEPRFESMKAKPMPAEDIDALVAYLGTLKKK